MQTQSTRFPQWLMCFCCGQAIRSNSDVLTEPEKARYRATRPVETEKFVNCVILPFLCGADLGNEELRIRLQNLVKNEIPSSILSSNDKELLTLNLEGTYKVLNEKETSARNCLQVMSLQLPEMEAEIYALNCFIDAQVQKIVQIENLVAKTNSKVFKQQLIAYIYI